MYKDKESKWNFVEFPSNVSSRSGEDATFDHFRLTPYRFIVREYIQNSMDAALSDDKPVTVEFSLGELDAKEYPELIGALKQHIEACKESCDANRNSRNPYNKKVEYITNHMSSPVPFLRIADYGTVGMDYDESGGQSAFTAGVREMGASNKEESNAGGSHGLGKAAGFVLSEINAVYTSTKTVSGDTYGEGSIRLCVHSLSGKKYFEDAFYDSHKGNRPDSQNEIPDVFKRTEIGTSIFILGVSLSVENVLMMKQEAVRSFGLAIVHKKLIVKLFGDEISADNFEERLKEYFLDTEDKHFDVASPKRIVDNFNPIPYYIDCFLRRLEDPTRHFVMTADSSDYPNLGHATLYIYKDDSIRTKTEDRIVCMRDKEMVIEIRRPGTHKGYYGIFVCDGDGSKYLRQIENVTHDEWVWSERLELDQDTKKKVWDVRSELKRFIKNSVSSLFPSDDNTEYKIPVLSQFIIAPGSRPSNNGYGTGNPQDTSSTPQSPISTVSDGLRRKRVEANKVGRVVIRKRKGVKKRKTMTTQSEDGVNIASHVVPGSPNGGAGDTPKTPSTPNPNPNPDPAPNVNPPKNNEPGVVGHDSGNGGKQEKKNGGSHIKDVYADFRVVPFIDDCGLVHRIIINSDDDYQSCSMVIAIAGAEAESNLKFSPIDHAYSVVGKEQNILMGFNLVKGKNNIDIKFEDNEFHSLSIKAYEN